MPERPLSPHLSVYRFMYTMTLSILHRLAGVWLALCLVALVYWLMGAAAGEGGYNSASAVLGGWFSRLLLLLGLAAFCYHFANGLRHLAWDAGWGIEKAQARRSALIVIVVAAIGFLVAGYLLFCPHAGVR